MIENIINKKNKIYEIYSKLSNDLDEYLDSRKNSLRKLTRNNIKHNRNRNNIQKDKLELIIRDEINFNPLEFSQTEMESILKEYEKITGIKIIRINEKEIKFDFQGIFNEVKEEECFVVLTYENRRFKLKKVSPTSINIYPYLNELNSTRGNLNSFFCALINKEYMK